jgi:uncharacterized protein
MQRINGRLIFSPSDLVTYFQSPFASWMDRARFENPSLNELIDPEDPLMASLAKQGYAHEASFNQSLAMDGLPLLELPRADPNTMQAATREAMQAGHQAIAQGYLQNDEFGGIADLLIRMEGASHLGDWHYEIWDTKLSRSVKPYFAIQLCAYADMIQTVQGRRPETVSVVLGTSERVPLRVSDYFAYYRNLKRNFLATQTAFNPKSMPDPALSSGFGRWSTYAAEILKSRDHPSLVANISRSQIKNLERAGITTVTKLASTHLDRVAKIGDPVFRRLKRQAALQLASQGKERPDFELTDHSGQELTGLKLLPPSSKNDVFFDIEGFPLIEGGLEYLWGATFYAASGEREFIDFWAHDQEQEKRAFSEFIDWVYARWSADPAMHIYHYAAYEVSAVRRLMGRYGIREHEVDQLLRNNVFVDLYQIVRQALIVGEPRYSIKNIEHLYRAKRQTEVTSGGDSVVVYEAWRENPDGDDWQSSKVLRDIRDYNRDDCDSTEELTRWLREEQLRAGVAYALSTEPKEPPKKEEREEVAALRDRLLTLSEQQRPRNPSRALMIETFAFSLEFHQRENKPMWWRFFDRQGMSEAELYDDMDCISGLERTARPPVDLGGKRKAKFSYEYRFDADQDFKGNASEYRILEPDARKVTIEEFDEKAGLLMVKADFEPPYRMSLIPFEFVNPKPIPGAIARQAERLLANNFQPEAITDFLLRSRPRICNFPDGPIILDETDIVSEVTEKIRNLESSCLCIQGPPGAGKTFTASHAIAALLRDGKKVGISSNSHKAVNNLMTAVLDRMAGGGSNASFIKVDRNGDRDPSLYERHDLTLVKSASEAAPLVQNGPVVVGGTAWAFAHDDLSNTLDYLFIDEAGQVAIANLIGMSSSTRNIVLMGDQMQLGQPIQGSHPGQSGQSVLEYYMEGHATMPPTQGVFLPSTFRMHLDVCRFISEMVYEGRLDSSGKALNRYLQPSGPLVQTGTGIVFHPVAHEGNTQASEEEIAAIVALVSELVGCPYADGESDKPRRLTLDDILFITPYNHQRRKLQDALGPHAKVGTVDKFQGQEAAVVIISMCASDANESPRGMDFLFSKNRLNVAVSRAKCLAIVVANSSLKDTAVTNLPQMSLVNLFCELADYGSYLNRLNEPQQDSN